MPFNHNVIELEVDKDKGSQIYGVKKRSDFG